MATNRILSGKCKSSLTRSISWRDSHYVCSLSEADSDLISPECIWKPHWLLHTMD